MNTATKIIVMKAALSRLNECRAKCPGVGGDVDAANLRHMIQHPNDIRESVLLQAANCLGHLSELLETYPKEEIAALRGLAIEVANAPEDRLQPA